MGEAEATATDLMSIMEEEKAKRRQTMLSNLGARLNFSGSFTRLTMVHALFVSRGMVDLDWHVKYDQNFFSFTALIF